VPSDNEAIKNNIVNTKGEIELTDSFVYLCDHDGLMGFVPNGLSFDLGNPDAYRYAVANFGKVNH
jgi:UTP-glucose-1-phosphate uridylyltransferase